MKHGAMARLVRAGLSTAVVDGLFSSVLSAFFYGSTVARLWQGVASVLLGPRALKGGTRAVLIGLLMHVCVAFTWSTIFLLLFENVTMIRRVVASPGGLFKIAAVVGPFIWMFMSCVVIPTLTHRPPAITIRWWIQFFGHIPFVALPIVASVARGTSDRPG